MKRDRSLWLVAQPKDNGSWEVQGIFDDYFEAVEYASQSEWPVMHVPANKRLPNETVPGHSICWFPHAEGPPQQLADVVPLVRV